ncbi:hypothetical protein BaRGS_00021044, partial [Batillaria attramentaria]
VEVSLSKLDFVEKFWELEEKASESAFLRLFDLKRQQYSVDGKSVFHGVVVVVCYC